MTKTSARRSRPLPGRIPKRGNVDRRRNLVDGKRQPPPPVRMFVHGAGNIGLVDHAQQILQRYREQAGFGPRPKNLYGIKTMTVAGVITHPPLPHPHSTPPPLHPPPPLD